MKKLILVAVSSASPYLQTIARRQSYKNAVFHSSKFAYSTSTIQEEKADLRFTELEEDQRAKKPDSVLRTVDKDVSLNATVDWSSTDEQSEFANEKPCTHVVELHERRVIKFRTNMKQLYRKYPGAENLCTLVLQKVPFSEHTLGEMIQQTPEISNFNPERVVSNISQLMELGFEANDIKLMVRSYPHLLDFDANDVTDSFEAWRSAKIGERYLIKIFQKYPSLFSLNDDEVKARLKRIEYLMMNKINRVVAVLERNPGIMDGKWDRVEEIFDYLYHTMRVTEKDMSRSKAFSSSLAFIKLRHTFLERCGVYIRPKLKEKTGFNPCKNPPLSSIIDTPDDVFAVNVAKVSPEEYDVFKKLMKFEESNENEYCLDGDDT